MSTTVTTIEATGASRREGGAGGRRGGGGADEGKGAGGEAGFADAAYQETGGRVVPDAAALYREADLVCKVQKPAAEEVEELREGQALVAFLQPLVNAELARALAERGVTAFSMDAIPRITRAQPMDALSSQATVAGYKAAVLAPAGP